MSVDLLANLLLQTLKSKATQFCHPTLAQLGS